MNENDWLVSTDLKSMLIFVRPNVSDRKLRLFAAACCRRLNDWRIQHGNNALLDEDDNRRIVEAIEDGADALLGEVAMSLEARAASPPKHITGETLLIRESAHADAWQAATSAAFRTSRCFQDWNAGDRITAEVVREIFGNPFHTTGSDPASRTAEVVEMAQAIYSDHKFSSMPQLADNLAGAGFTDGYLLEHLRGPGPHFRGCWALDLVLGKN